jgi:predicted MPP superfamily phosphohydrolase
VTRIAWCSDIHLNFVPFLDSTLEHLVSDAQALDAEMLVICGDISGGEKTLQDSLTAIELAFGNRVFFVLGNHDFYRLTFAEGHEIARQAVRNSVLVHDDDNILCWLTDGIIERLSDDAVLIGHDGWYDARTGLLQNKVFLNDFYEIGDFSPLSAISRIPGPLIMRMREAADEAAAYFDMMLPKALAQARKVVLATHVPPFPQAAWHDGKQSDPDWMPFFCSVCVGNVLVKYMEANPDKELLVLCGHTHGEGEVQILPNLKVLTAGARYGHPKLQGIIEV